MEQILVSHWLSHTLTITIIIIELNDERLCVRAKMFNHVKASYFYLWDFIFKEQQVC